MKTYQQLFYEESPELNKDEEKHLSHCRAVEFPETEDCGHAMRCVEECSNCWNETIK